MPEYPEVEGAQHVITRGKGSGLQPRAYEQLKFFAQVVPLCLSLGTEKHRFESIITNRDDYTLDAAPSADIAFVTQHCPQWPPSAWRARAKEVNKSWSYMLEPPKALGPLICVNRGKLLVMAAGNHAFCICLGLEGNIFGMKIFDFLEIVTNDTPGPNPDPEKAEQIRTFVIPERFIVPGSSERRPRTIKIFAAFISAHWVYVVSDFSGLVRMHVKSKDSPWTREDLVVGSEQWKNLFGSFKGGPDWVLERPLAMSAIQNWRLTILEEHRRWELRVAELQAQHDSLPQSQTLPITEYFSTTSGRYLSPPILPPLSLPPEPRRPIIKELCTNSLGAFSGFGRHLANDFLHLQLIFPGTPSRFICEKNEDFEVFSRSVEQYLTSFTTNKFLNSVTSIANSSNPFAFNETSNTNYMRHHILVFRRTRVMVPRQLYIAYCKKGLLDPDHTIGNDYPADKAEVLIGQFKDKKFKWIRVYLFAGGLRAYSIIRAKCPQTWGLEGFNIKVTKVIKDITQFGYATTIGLAQFHEQLLNRVISPVIQPEGGKPAKVHTGKRGRPANAKFTKRAAARLTKSVRGRFSGRSQDPHTEAEWETESDDDGGETENTNPIDSDDNAGDADAHGDGSAALEDKFMEYDCQDESESDEEAQSNEAGNLVQVERLVDGVLRDARFALENFSYFEPRFANPYDRPLQSRPKKKLLPGIMDYRRAHSILKNKMILDQKRMIPYFNIWLKYGTTLPDQLQKKNIDPSKIYV